MPRYIDHLVLAVPDLAATADHYGRLGFTVGGENRHPWGTVNRVVRLGGAYLELIALASGFASPAPEDPASPFAGLVEDAVRREGALAAVAFGSDDADADAASFRAAGLGSGQRLDFSREARGSDGRPRVLRFGLAFVDAPPLGLAHLFTCRHHQSFGDGAGPRHANGALRLGRIVIEAGNSEDCAPILTAVIGTAPHGPAEAPSFHTATGRIDIVPGRNGVAGRFSGFSVVVEDFGRLRAALESRCIHHEALPGRVAVPPSPLTGAALAFVPAACHSGP